MTKEKNSFVPFLVVLIVMALIAVGFISWKKYLATPYPVGIESGGMMTDLSNSYTNANPVYSIRYPNGWKIDSSDANLTPEKQGATLLITKGDISFRIVAFSPDSSALKFPTICQFPDSNYKGSLVIGKDYTEFKSGGSIYRVTPTLPMAGSGVGGGYKEVCLKEADGDKFTNKIDQVNISYIVPDNFDEKNIEILNSILSTFWFGYRPKQ